MIMTRICHSATTSNRVKHLICIHYHVHTHTLTPLTVPFWPSSHSPTLVNSSYLGWTSLMPCSLSTFPTFFSRYCSWTMHVHSTSSEFATPLGGSRDIAPFLPSSQPSCAWNHCITTTHNPNVYQHVVYYSGKARVTYFSPCTTQPAHAQIVRSYHPPTHFFFPFILSVEYTAFVDYFPAVLEL